MFGKNAQGALRGRNAPFSMRGRASFLICRIPFSFQKNRKQPLESLGAVEGR